MNLTKLKNRLSEDIDNEVEVYKLLKDGFGAKAIDILFYDETQEVFFDKINKIKIDKSLLDDKSIIGNAFITKNSYFSTDIESESRYNPSLDNPLNITMESQIVIPIFHNNNPEGIVRFSQLPSVFCSKDYDNLVGLIPIFTKMFLKDNSSSVDELVSDELDMVDVFDKLYQITTLFDNISAQKINIESKKMISLCRENIDKIITSIYPENSYEIDNNEEKEKLDISMYANVLIADDVSINTKILNAMLMGNQVVENIKCAHTKDETVAVLNDYKQDNKHIHLLFIDHHIPGLLDLEITEELRIKDTFRSKVIVVSITNDPDTLKNENLFYDYSMPKPFTKERVNEVMAQITKEHFLS